MRNSAAIRAGVPAPFTTLEPLRLYLTLLKEVVDEPTSVNLTAYVCYDREIFTPVASTSYWHDKVDSCILYDNVQSYAVLAQIPDTNSEEFARAYGRCFVVPAGLTFSRNEDGFPIPEFHSTPAMPDDAARERVSSGAGLRNAARGVVNELVKCVAASGAFPADRMSEAYQMLDDALLDLVGDNRVALAFARKRMRNGLLNVWVRETQWDASPHTGDHDEILRNVALGWRFYGAPYGAAWIAKLAGRLELRRYF